MVEKCIYGETCPSCNFPIRKVCAKFVNAFIDEATASIKAKVTAQDLARVNPLKRFSGKVYMHDDYKTSKAIVIRTLLHKLVRIKCLSFNLAVTYGLEQMEIEEEFVFIDASTNYSDNLKAIAVIESYADVLSDQNKIVLIYTKNLSLFKTFVKC